MVIMYVRPSSLGSLPALVLAGIFQHSSWQQYFNILKRNLAAPLLEFTPLLLFNHSLNSSTGPQRLCPLRTSHPRLSAASSPPFPASRAAAGRRSLTIPIGRFPLHYGALWCPLVCIMVNYGELWCPLVCITVHYGVLPCALRCIMVSSRVHYGALWCPPVYYSALWCPLACIMVSYIALWCIMVSPSALWCIMVSSRARIPRSIVQPAPSRLVSSCCTINIHINIHITGGHSNQNPR